jgi:hypothetical protein
MSLLVSEIATAACDGVRTCALTEVPDRGVCGFETTYTEPILRAFVRSFTPFPAMFYVPESGGCGNGSEVRYMYKNATDPESADSPHWRVWTRSSILSTDGRCIVPEGPDGALMVLDIRGLSGDTSIAFGRVNETQTQEWFEAGNPQSEWIEPYVQLSFEMDDRYLFPGCCALPQNFTDTEGRVWRQAAYESVCDVVDSAEYVYQGVKPTTTASHNETHEAWRFEVSGPLLCGPTPLFPDFEIQAYIPLNSSALVDEDATEPPRWLLAPTTPVQDISWIVLITVSSAFVLALLIASRNTWMSYLQKKKKVTSQ